MIHKLTESPAFCAFCDAYYDLCDRSRMDEWRLLLYDLIALYLFVVHVLPLIINTTLFALPLVPISYCAWMHRH
jgi:hypothetical protein